MSSCDSTQNAIVRLIEQGAMGLANGSLPLALYSDDQKVTVVLDLSSSDALKVYLTNTASSVSDMNPINLFQPFVRGNHTQNQNGSGLGLSIVKRIPLIYWSKKIMAEINKLNTYKQ